MSGLRQSFLKQNVFSFVLFDRFHCQRLSCYLKPSFTDQIRVGTWEVGQNLPIVHSTQKSPTAAHPFTPEERLSLHLRKWVQGEPQGKPPQM